MTRWVSGIQPARCQVATALERIHTHLSAMMHTLIVVCLLDKYRIMICYAKYCILVIYILSYKHYQRNRNAREPG